MAGPECPASSSGHGAREEDELFSHLVRVTGTGNQRHREGQAVCHQSRCPLLPAPRPQQHLRWLQTPEGEPAGQAGPQVPPAKRIPSADALQRQQTARRAGERSRRGSTAAGVMLLLSFRHPQKEPGWDPNPEPSRIPGALVLRMRDTDNCTRRYCPEARIPSTPA